MKKIAIFAPYVGSINRGAETFVIELTKKLSQKYCVDVYTMSRENQIQNNVIVVDVTRGRFFCLHENLYNKHKYYRKIINKFYFLIPDVIFQKKFTKKAFEIVKEKKYDLLFPNNGVWGARYSARYKDENDVPFIYTGHGGIGLGEKYIIESNPNAYVCLTNKHLEWANKIKKGNTVKTIVIPNGVNVDSFEEGKSKNGKRIISVAALTAFKRHELTIKAVSQIEDVELVILGKGEEENDLKILAEKLLGSRCKITSTSYSNVKSYYSSADLFVLPSIEEPFGIVYLEAMASNLPIVAPNDSQRKEIIGDAGLYCDVENIDLYANTIKNALKIDWKHKPLERARQYDWSLIVKKYETLIEEVVHKDK